MVGIDEQITTWNEDHGDQRLPEASDGFRKIIKIKKLRNIKNIMLFSSVIKNVNEESTVVLESDCIYFTIITLFNLIHFDVLTFVNSSKQLVMLGQWISYKLKVFILVIDYRNAFFGIISDDDLNNIHLCINISS